MKNTIIILIVIAQILSTSVVLGHAQDSIQDNFKEMTPIPNLYWGDTSETIMEVLGASCRKPTATEMNEFTGMLSSGKTGRTLSRVSDDIQLFGINFKVYFFESKGKLVAISTEEKESTKEGYDRLTSNITKLYGEKVDFIDTKGFFIP